MRPATTSHGPSEPEISAMKKEQLAVQLYTVRDFCQTAADLAKTVERVRQMGYPAVQVSGVGPIPVEEIKSICADAGVTICATHEKADLIRQEPAQVVERLQQLGCRVTAYPYPAGVDFGDPVQLESLIQDLARAGAVLAEAGLSLGYHHHAIEFLRRGDRTVLETILERVDPRHLWAEVDTYWIQYGGGDPVAWCERMTGRMEVIHLKDYGFTANNEPAFAEVGNGNLDFERIVAAAEKSGCRWFVVEQDICPGDPFDSLQQSYDYLVNHLVAD